MLVTLLISMGFWRTKRQIVAEGSLYEVRMENCGWITKRRQATFAKKKKFFFQSFTKLSVKIGAWQMVIFVNWTLEIETKTKKEKQPNNVSI